MRIEHDAIRRFPDWRRNRVADQHFTSAAAVRSDDDCLGISATRRRGGVSEFAYVAPRTFIDQLYRTHVGKIKTHQLASLGGNDQCVSYCRRFIGIDLRLTFFDRQNRSRSRPVCGGNENVRALKLSQHSGQPALIFILSSRFD